MTCEFETKLQKCIRMGITIFKMFMWGGISWDIGSEITFYFNLMVIKYDSIKSVEKDEMGVLHFCQSNHTLSFFEKLVLGWNNQLLKNN